MKKNNKGFSVITVIVAIAFIGIMAMIVLYISMSNFQMKVTDLKAKNSFYKAENALDEIRSGLQEDVSEAMTDAYVAVLETYKNAGGVSEAEKQSKFQEEYMKNLRGRLQQDGAPGRYNMQKIKGYVDMLKVGGITEDESLLIVNPQGLDPVMTKGGTESGFVLKNLKVVYVDPKGRASIIETDIRLGVPHVVFPDGFEPPDLMKMNSIAGEGILCGESDASLSNAAPAPITISGNVYAGQKIADGIVFNDGKSLDILPNQAVEVNHQEKERLVCLGDISVADGGSFTEKGFPETWAQGLIATSADVSLSGTNYFADDLTLNTTPNTGDGSTVRISGTYYGYGSSASAKGSHFGENKYRGWTNTAMNSSIIINGKGSTLDLSSVETLMLSGNSYIGTSKIPANENVGTRKSNDVLTGESITVKGNQLAYLVDPDCFTDKKYTNPMTFDTYLEIGDAPLFDMEKPIDAWGGKSLNQLGLNAGEPVQKVFYSGINEGFVYFYLNFASPKNASDFFQMYYNTPEVKATMDKYLNFYLGQDEGIRMTPESIVRFVTKGNTLSYDGNVGEGTLKAATSPQPSDIQIQEQITYQNMWYALTKKMIPAYDRLKDNVKKDGEIHHSEKDGNRTLFQNTVDEDALTAFLKGNSEQYFECSSADAPAGVYVVNNKGGEEFSVTGDVAAKCKLIVATGDVVVHEGVAFTGVIMAQGKLTLKPGASLNSVSLEASKAYQAQLKNYETQRINFFWDGNQYLLGNGIAEKEEGSETGEEKKEEEDIYDLSECITFENWKKK